MILMGPNGNKKTILYLTLIPLGSEKETVDSVSGVDVQPH
jgi:hypothetical protein